MSVSVSKDNDVLDKAFVGLFGADEKKPSLSLRYSSKFSPYNANVKMTGPKSSPSSLSFSLSREFESCEDTIRIGILQHLLNKIYKTNIPTIEQDIYEKFLKNVTRYASRGKSDAVLVELFEELNDEYFNGYLEQPYLVFGTFSTTTLGHYAYTQDKVTISTALKSRPDLVKYVLYHELLHKKHSFSTVNGRTHYHTPAFRREEALYKDANIEKKLESYLRTVRPLRKKKSKKRSLTSWFR